MSSQAESLKAQGNELFKKGRLGPAIDAYTEAIALRPNVPVYWTNRALCFRKKNEWERVQEDCRKALELDKESMKAHYMLGLAMLQFKHFSEAIRELQKALELARSGPGSGSDMVEEIWEELSKAKYSKWEADATVRRDKQRRLREHLQRLLKEEQERTKQQKASTNDAGAEDGDVVMLSEDEDSEYAERLNTLANVFEKAEAPDRTAEIPDYLCCNITMDIFRDPVITPSGITYERVAISDHLQRGRKFDPVTRAPLTADQIVPNLAMREAVQSYLDDHGWAYRTFRAS